MCRVHGFLKWFCFLMFVFTLKLKMLEQWKRISDWFHIFHRHELLFLQLSKFRYSWYNSWCSRTSQLLRCVSLINLLAISLSNLMVIGNVKESFAIDRSMFSLITYDRFCRFLPLYFTETVVCKAKILHVLLNNLQVWSILEAKKGTSRSYEDMGPKNCILAVSFCTHQEFDRKGVSQMAIIGLWWLPWCVIG